MSRRPTWRPGPLRIGSSATRPCAATLRPWLASLTVALFLAGSAFAPPPAFGQEPVPPALKEAGSTPLVDVPTGPARITGRVVHARRAEAVAGVEIVLYALGLDGQPGSRRTESDADGAFVFESISNDPGVVYLVGARYAGLPFPGDRLAFDEGQTERDLEVRISEPIESIDDIEVVQSSLRVSLGGERLAVAEVHRLRNRGTQVFNVDPERRAQRKAPLHVELMADADGFAMPLGLVPEGIVREGRDLRFWGPLYPGEQEISFRYDVPIEVGLQTLRKRFPSAAQRIRVFGAESGPIEGVAGLEQGESVEEQGFRFQAWEVAEPGKGFETELTLRIPEQRFDGSAVRLGESQLVLEVDDVTLQVKEQHRVEVDGDAVVRARPGELLLELPLPEGAEDIRFSADANELGLVRTDDGVGLIGPLQPGTHGVGLAYGLRSSPAGIEFERSFDRHLPLIRAFVADTGVAVETSRLHRRRPVRDADRTYLIFEAYELDPREPLQFSMTPLPPRVGSNRPALALGLVLGVACLAFLIAPIRGEEDGEAPEEESESERNEREHLYESIRDLDHDYETGKLDEAGWKELRAELRSRAVRLLAAERSAAAAERTGAEATPGSAASDAGATGSACPSCGAEVRPGDQFCASCGTPLAGPPA